MGAHWLKISVMSEAELTAGGAPAAIQLDWAAFSNTARVKSTIVLLFESSWKSKFVVFKKSNEFYCKGSNFYLKRGIKGANLQKIILNI